MKDRANHPFDLEQISVLLRSKVEWIAFQIQGISYRPYHQCGPPLKKFFQISMPIFQIDIGSYFVKF